MRDIFNASWQNCFAPYTPLSSMVFLLLHLFLYCPLTLIFWCFSPSTLRSYRSWAWVIDFTLGIGWKYRAIVEIEREKIKGI